MTQDERTTGDVDVDLGYLFAALRRDWKSIAVFVLCVTAAAFLLASLATPKFRAEARLLIETRESVFTRPQAAEGLERNALDPENVSSQVEIISSSEILAQVAEDLDLYGLQEFEGGGTSWLGRFLVGLGLRSDPGSMAQEERVLRAMRERLRVYRIDSSRVIVIQFSSSDSELAARVPNAIADAYIASQRAAMLASNADATQWLAPEIVDLRNQVREAEERVADFRARSDLLVGQNNTVLATQQLAEMSSELSRVRAARSAAEAKARTVRATIEGGGSLDTLPDVLASPLIQRLRERQVDLRAQIADLSTTLLANHPRIRALRSQLSDLNSQTEAEVRKVQAGLEAEAATALQRERELMEDLDDQKVVSARAEQEQVELRALEREATSRRALLEVYLTRHQEAAARVDRSYLPVDARVFSRAIEPSQAYFPKIMPIALAAFAGSLLLAGVAVLLRELFSGRAMRPARGGFAPVRRVEMPAVAETARLDEDVATRALAAAVGAEGEVDVEAAAAALIASGVARAIFVSPEGDEAAATAVLVAREIADSGLRVLLLDLTASGAASRPMLESFSYPGITNLLASEAQFADVIHADLYSACHVIPVGTSDPARAMRSIDRLPIIMGSLTTAYDLVVVECGMAEADAIVRLMEDDAQVLVSVIDPAGDDVAAAALALREEGLGEPLRVTPLGHVPPTAPPGRDVA